MSNITKKTPSFISFEKGDHSSTSINILPQHINFQDHNPFFLASSLTEAAAYALSMNKNGAIYISIPEHCLHIFLPAVLQLNFSFHRYLNNVYTYYKWNVDKVEDKVPMYATSIEGVQVCCSIMCIVVHFNTQLLLCI